MLRKIQLTLAAALAVLVAGTASADDFETFVGGDVEIDVAVGNVTTEAGYQAAAETDIGTINRGSFIGGDATIYVRTGDVTTTADFRGQACTSIGSVGGCLNQDRGF